MDSVEYAIKKSKGKAGMEWQGKHQCEHNWHYTEKYRKYHDNIKYQMLAQFVCDKCGEEKKAVIKGEIIRLI